MLQQDLSALEIRKRARVAIAFSNAEVHIHQMLYKRHIIDTTQMPRTLEVAAKAYTVSENLQCTKHTNNTDFKANKKTSFIGG